MLISIVIPNYNGERYLDNCIKSLLNQVYRDYEIIIVDNASIDNSCNLILERYPMISLIKLDENYGFSRAVNEGIKVSQGEYVVLLNNDTVVENTWLLNLVNCIEKDRKIFSCCSKMIRYHEKDKIDDAGDEYTILGWAFKRGDGESIKHYSKNKKVFSSCAGAAIYRKEIFNEIGYFDENFFAYIEDLDISYRAMIYGYKNLYCSNAYVYHIGSATSGSRHNSFKVKLAARNNAYLVYKNMPIIQVLFNLPFLIVGWSIKLLFFYYKGFGKEYLSGIKEGIINLKRISKIKYRNKNFINYIKIQWYITINLFKVILKL
ncbi:glycosyltransferase family 2 protein [Clostridium aciditolerans]|uniref:Glycosyltransferase family 2 protein n=1 Tax=Clostridium aciditolerans TaxID=339861 RepID=A0A934M734_9CLOT|nr:glycosyltransferase family 2 protein [Clostridium aciditolerans]MBI6873601.1 glycosyltransferase family 2 protein [Clostridium aciditolerans]